MTLAQAKKLRGNMTDAERRLWYHLRAHRFDGHKIKRQVPIGPYIVDFACLGRKLVIEDGGQHAENRTMKFATAISRTKDFTFSDSGTTMCSGIPTASSR